MATKKVKTKVNGGEDMGDIGEDIDESDKQIIGQNEDNIPVESGRRVCGGIDCQQLCQSPNEGYCTKCLTNIGNFFKQRDVNQSPITPAVTKKPMVLLPVIKCSVNGCTTFCTDQTAMKKHLEVDHKLIVIDSSAAETVTSRDTDSKETFAEILKRSCSVMSSNPKTIGSPIIDKSVPKVSTLEKTTLGKGFPLERQTKEVLLNMIEYFRRVLPNESQEIRLTIVESATKIKVDSLKGVLKEFRTTGALKAPNKLKPRKDKYNCNEEDRQILSDIVYKLKDEDRLRGYKSVMQEMRNCDQYKPTIKRCNARKFAALFKKYGFRINQDRIIDISPAESEREQIACQRSKESGSDKYVCDWPGCQKQFNLRVHLIVHLRTHTGVKPYVCRFANCHYRCAVSGNFAKHLKLHNKVAFDDDNEDL